MIKAHPLKCFHYKYVWCLVFLISMRCAPCYSQATDTFKIANRLRNEKKFKTAIAVVEKYKKTHKTDFNVYWLLGETELWVGDYKLSKQYYLKAMRLAPGNDYLRISFIKALLDMREFAMAKQYLSLLEPDDDDYAAIQTLYAKLSYWQGDYSQAITYTKQAIGADEHNTDALALYREIKSVMSPWLTLATAYSADNQPLHEVVSSIKAGDYFNHLASLYVDATDYHFSVPKTPDALWMKAGDKAVFSKIGLQAEANAGVVKFPYGGKADWSGSISLSQKLSRQVDISVVAEHAPYLYTLSSITDTAISTTQFSGLLNWHKNTWKAQAAYIINNFPDNNYVYTAYAWLYAPVIKLPVGKLQIGYSYSYSNSKDGRYNTTQSVAEILANYTTGTTITGIYDPYFTPVNLQTNAILVSYNTNVSRHLSFYLNGDLGYASASNPYLYLNTNTAGDIVIARGYATTYFVPADATASLLWHASRSVQLSMKYIYRNTYFFSSNYIGISFQKSFWNEKDLHKTQPEKE